MEITLCSRAPPLMNLISLHYPSLHSVSLTQNNTPSALFSPLWRKLVGEKKRRKRRSLFSVSFQVQWASHPVVYFISALSHSRGGVYPPWLHVHGNKSEFCLSTQWGKMQWNVHVHSNKKSFLKKFFLNPTYLCNVAVIPHDMKNHTGTLEGEDVLNSGLKKEIWYSSELMWFWQILSVHVLHIKMYIYYFISGSWAERCMKTYVNFRCLWGLRSVFGVHLYCFSFVATFPS